MAKSRIGFWFKDNQDTYLQLPVNPPEFSYESPYGIETVNIVGLGEVSILDERGVKRISFDSFFPRDYNPSYCEYEGFLAPWKWVDQFEKWRDTRRNIRLIIAGTPISLPCYVESFTLNPEKAGSPDDVYYSITLVEFRPTAIKVLQTDAKGKTTVKSVSTEVNKTKGSDSSTYTVKSGDTLWKIAKIKYKDGSKWKRIYDANEKIIGKSSDDIKVGQKLVIPK